MKNGAKKSFYVFLSSLLGMMLFILLQRSLFLLAYLFGVRVLSPEFAHIDYVTFVVATFGGLWYGIWVGMYWYQLVYEEGRVGGLLSSWFGRSHKNAARLLADSGDAWSLEDLVKAKADEYQTATVTPRLEVFESNTVAFSASAPLHADDLHQAHAKAVKPKRIRRTIKKK